MKKILFVAIATILLAAGCEKTEIFNRTGDAMTFSSEMGKLTKAANSEGMDNLKEYGFKVWAYRNFEDEYYNGADKETYPKGLNAIYDGMKAIDVTFNDPKWGTDKDYYWPGTDKQLKFYAVALDTNAFKITENNVTIEHNSTTPEATGTITITDFTVNANADNDLMIADPIVQAQLDRTNGNAVKPQFRHTLSKVQFNFKTDGGTLAEHPVYIQSIETSELTSKGSITYPVAEGKTTPWTLGSDNAKFTDNNTEVITLRKKTDENGIATEIEVDGEVVPTGGKADRTGLTLTAEFQTLDTWLLLPQDIQNATLKITYIIKNRQFERTLPLATTNLPAWNTNQFIKYNIVVAPNLITFEPKVEDWDETNVEVDDNGSTATNATVKTYESKNTAGDDVTVKVHQFGTTPAVGETASPNGTFAITGGEIVIENGKVKTFTATTTPDPSTPAE